MGAVQDILQTLTSLPSFLLYILLGAGAAVENVIPPIPADTFVLAGALLSARGSAEGWIVFLVTWLANVASATAVYFLGRRYGRSFFQLPVARWLLHPHQLDQIGGFYDRWGVPAIFLSRFLPGLRAMVPVFAGVSGVRAWSVIPPVLIASGLWYGLLVYLGAAMGRNLDRIVAIFNNLNSVLLWIAVALAVGVGIWWWRSRHHHGHEHGKHDQ